MGRETHTNIATLEHTDDVLSVAFSPDGTTLASGLYSTVELWDVETHTNIATLKGHRGDVLSVAFSPDGTTLASTGLRDKTVKLWDVETHTNIATLEGHTDGVLSVAFSPDGTLLASGSRRNESTVKLWDVETRTNIATLAGHKGDGPFRGVFTRRDHPRFRRGEHLMKRSSCGMWKRIQISPLLKGIRMRSFPWHFHTMGHYLLQGRMMARSSYGTYQNGWSRPFWLVIISGDDQQGTPGAALPNPLIVEVRDLDNNPLPDVQVTFYGHCW